MTRVAITRQVSDKIAHCELTHLAREPIDLERARAQHAEYERCLAELGCTVISLPAEPDLPDSVFVEDTAVVLDELALITRPGAVSRRAETATIATALKPYRSLRSIESPGTLDGGDVLVAGKTVFVGRSGRTDETGIERMREVVAPLGYEVRAVEIRGCLHLKSAVTLVAPDRLLVNPDQVDPDEFAPLTAIEIDPDEPAAANALLVGDSVLYSSAYPATRRRLERLGITVRTVDASELAKAEGGVTCCSLIFDA